MFKHKLVLLDFFFRKERLSRRNERLSVDNMRLSYLDPFVLGESRIVFLNIMKLLFF